MNICSLWFLLVFIGCVLKKWVISAQSFKRGQNIGTVLFEKNDYQKQCWTSEEFTVLSSRRIFQDILPQMRVIDSENDRYVAHLMDYFHICLESVQRLSVGKTKHLMLKALADTLGGYLRVYILPLTKHSYYVGNIKYRDARMLYELFDELKVFLRTNGIGWSRPSRDVGNVEIPLIVVTPPKTSAACNGLITYSAPQERDDSDRSFAFRKRKGSTAKRRHSRQIVDEHNSEVATRKIIVPLPFLDDEAEPNSIALPFKTDSLQSLYSEKSAFVVVRYYIASVKCIASQSDAHLKAFNEDFHNWLRQSVRRHLDDEKWYPAFGGVLRVLATSRRLGAKGDVAKSKTSGTYQVMPKVERNGQTVGRFYKVKGESDDNAMRLGTTEIIIIAIVSALVIWLLVGLCLVCYRFLVKRPEGCPPCESKTAPFVVLYENEDYCQPDTCPSKSSRRNVAAKLKEWWRDRFGRCPGGCQEDEERCLAAVSYSSKNTAVNSKTYPKKRYTRSASALPSGIMPRSRASFRHSVCYSSEESTTTFSDSPVQTRKQQLNNNEE